MIIELVGGPDDGMLREMPDGEHRLDMYVSTETWGLPLSEPTEPDYLRPQVRLACYRPQTEADLLLGRWIWEGPQ